MPDTEYISRQEHEEFAKRMDEANARICDEDKRQNERLKKVEESVAKINEVVASIKELTLQMKTMTDTLVDQGKSIKELEQKPSKRWETLVSDVIKLIVAAVMGFALAKIGLGG